MRLEIDGGGYQTARQAFAEANQLAALGYDRLTGSLAGYGAMAGDDSTSWDFAAAYDQGAREAVASLADLADSCTGLGHLTTVTLANHARAEARSVLAGSTVYDGGLLPDVGEDTGYVVVLPSAPPTCVGADSAPVPGRIGWILDHVEGFVWPGADTSLLREAAGAWRAAAAALTDLETCCDSAIRGFWAERSPEIPLAIDATHTLKTTIRGLGEQLGVLATACEEYADQVEARRAEIIHLAEWLLEQVVEGVLISVAIGALTGGTGTAAGLTAVAARVAAESPTFLRILETLRAAAAGIASGIRATRESLAAARVTLTRFKDAAVARSAAQGEAGELRLLWARGSGWLRAHERAGGHTLERHVGKSDEELLERLRTQPGIQGSSTFTDERSAERVIGSVLERERSSLENWARGEDDTHVLRGDLGRVIGRGADQTGTIRDLSRMRMFIVRDGSMPDGFRIVTAYPTR